MSPSMARVHAPPAGPSSLQECLRELDGVTVELFALDPRIMSVGIGLVSGGHGFRVVRQQHPQLRALRQLDARVSFEGLRGFAVEVVDVGAPIVSQVKLSVTRPTSARTQEQQRQRPLSPGAQLQNWDCDARDGLLEGGEIEVGSLGAVVETDGRTLLLSNNHVLAGQNRGQRGDRIAQPGGEILDARDVVARLERFVSLQVSPAGAHPRWGNVAWNEVDAAVASVAADVSWQSGFGAGELPHMCGIAPAELGDTVFKIGRTTGLTRGRVVGVAERVGPVGYSTGDCWFRSSFTVETEDGQPFSDGGDSGAAIVRSDGTVLGLVYAGNGVQTYACPIGAVLEQLELPTSGFGQRLERNV